MGNCIYLLQINGVLYGYTDMDILLYHIGNIPLDTVYQVYQIKDHTSKIIYQPIVV